MQKQEFEFRKCLENGKKGESDVLEKLSKLYPDYFIKYVGDDKEYQEIDIDFLMQKDEEEIKIEVKTDYTLYNNMFAELMSSEELGTTGCWLKTESDYIIYYFVAKRIMYILPTKQAQDIALHGNWKIGRAFDKLIKNGKKVVKTSVGALIPVDEMLKLVNFTNSKFEKYIEL